MYYASVLEIAMLFCFFDDQLISLSPKNWALICADITKILRKRLKLGKHEHGNGRARKEPGESLVYVIEFQKRGLPHAHILLWLEEHCKCKTPSDIDDIISAELPSPTDDPNAYKIVTDYMLHGPCGKDARNVACTTDGKCSKHFPKQFLAETFFDEEGYPHYRRRDNKYLNKGLDKATIVIEENVTNGTAMAPEKVLEVDEIKNYLNFMQLSFHLPNQNAITLRDSEKLPALLEKEGIDVIMFTDWFELNKRDPAARAHTYAEIPKHYDWHDKDKPWKQRKQRKCIGRIVYSSPASGERYYLRMLLNVVRGVQSFKELMTVNNRLYATFKETCFAYGLLNDDKEWTHALSEASVWALGPQLWDIFVTMLLFYDVSRPLKLWEENWQTLARISSIKSISFLTIPSYS
ncbi:hypothetical protein Tco_0811839 [Tanacetum coccineum]